MTAHGNRFEQAWTPERVLDAVMAWCDETGKPPTSTAWETGKPAKYATKALDKARQWQEVAQRYENGHYPSNDTVRRLFGTFNAMLEAAGLPARPEGRTPRAVSDTHQAMLRSRNGGMHAGPDQLAHDIRSVTHARTAGDQHALKAALLELAATAMAWCDAITLDDQEVAA